MLTISLHTTLSNTPLVGGAPSGPLGHLHPERGRAGRACRRERRQPERWRAAADVHGSGAVAEIGGAGDGRGYC